MYIQRCKQIMSVRNADPLAELTALHQTSYVILCPW